MAPGLTIVGKNGTIGGKKRAAGVPLACLRRLAGHISGGCLPAVMTSGGVAGLTCCEIGSPAGRGGACGAHGAPPGLTIVGKNGTIGGEKRAAGVPFAYLRGSLLAGLMMPPCRGAVGG